MAAYDVEIRRRWSNGAEWELLVPGNDWNQEILLRLEDLHHPVFMEFCMGPPGLHRMSFRLREGAPRSFALTVGELFLVCTPREVNEAMAKVVEALPNPSILE
jgi:hypothetical protein